jgi:pSer/pThr/pTyr-binding forkhead associated (FHA) protein/S1-C subfamily serine protease
MRCGRFISLVLAGVVASLAGSSVAGAKETPPLSKQRAIALASPGVVYIETSFTVHVVLKVFDEVIAQNTYRDVPYGSGSGFVVDPNGTIITARHVVKPADRDVRNYAANRLFVNLGENEDPFLRYTLSDSVLNHRLQQCYDAIVCTFQVTPHVIVWTGVALGGANLNKGMDARVLKISERGANNTDIGILDVDGKNMPTTALAQTVDGMQQGDDIISLGFPGTAQENNLTAPHSKAGTVGTVGTVGTTKQLEVDIAVEQGMSGGPVINLRGQVVGVNSYYVPRSTGESGTKYARSIDDARELLRTSGGKAGRGPLDQNWQQAVDLYFLHHYSAAIPVLNAVLTASPGHPFATDYLQRASALKGTKADRPLGGGGIAWWVIGLIIVGALALLGAVGYLWRRGSLSSATARRGSRRAPTERARHASETVTGDGMGDAPSVTVGSGASAGQQFAVQNELSIGREEADITLDDDQVSRRHALLRRAGRELEVSDTGSSNGTYVNGQRIDGSKRLSDGDSIRVGNTSLAVVLPGRRAIATEESPTLVVTGGGDSGKRFPIDRERSIGRETADIIIDDAEISRRHASVRPVEGGLEISDLQSSNGTYVNGNRINGGHRLSAGDQIRIGETTLVVEIPTRSTGTVVHGGTVIRPHE